MSVTAAVNSSPPDSVPVIVTVPSSSTLVRSMVTVMVASVVVVSVSPAASLPSWTLTVTL